ncbi:MAG: hypothetical protein HKO93_00280 [Flavobacteriales bacterium]|nr:hypothetical protein [Flavobacteriales bacterium]
MTNTVLKFLLTAFFVIGLTFAISAQTGPPIQGPGPGGCFPPPCIPVDGGLSLLIAAGIGLAGKKAYDYHKEQ